MNPQAQQAQQAQKAQQAKKNPPKRVFIPTPKDDGSDSSDSSDSNDDDNNDDDDDDDDDDEDDDDDDDDEDGTQGEGIEVDLSENVIYQGISSLFEDEEGNNILQYFSLLHTELIGIKASLENLAGIRADIKRLSDCAEKFLALQTPPSPPLKT